MPRPGDIIVTTPPKCGTTWMLMCCALLVHGARLPRPLGELTIWFDQELRSIEDVVRTYEVQDHRRVIKTHTPLDGLPWHDEVLYIGVGRDPRDVALSMANHITNIDGDVTRRARAAAGHDDHELPLRAPPGGHTAFAAWMADETPVEAFRSSLRFTIHHLAQLWERRGSPNVLLFHYSDMRADLRAEMCRLAAALEVDTAELDTLVAAASFESMKDSANHLVPDADLGVWRDNSQFFAEGRLGGWRATIDHDTLAAYEARVAELCGDRELLSWLHR